MPIKKYNTQRALEKFAKTVIKSARGNLTRHGRRHSDALYDSLDGFVHVGANSFQMNIEMEDYGIFVDKGVKGVDTSFKSPESPFQFGTGTGEKGGLTQAINNWVQDKGIQFTNIDGGFMTHEQTVGLIVGSIWRHGLKTTNFISNPFENNWEYLPDNFVEAYALDVDEFFQHTLGLDNNVTITT